MPEAVEKITNKILEKGRIRKLTERWNCPCQGSGLNRHYRKSAWRVPERMVG